MAISSNYWILFEQISLLSFDLPIAKGSLHSLGRGTWESHTFFFQCEEDAVPIHDEVGWTFLGITPDFEVQEILLAYNESRSSTSNLFS